MSDSSPGPGGERSLSDITIKICGITNPADALQAIEFGADALGFNLYPGSKRFIEIDSAVEWIGQLPSGVAKVAVLVNPSRDEALGLVRLGVFDSLQLHGNESSEFCHQLAQAGVPFTKALPMGNKTSLELPTNYFTSSILLDSISSGGFGGSGRTFSWPLARRFVEAHPEFRVILAGGLTAENVAEAIEVVRPAGVDVTSGVEAEFGRKDTARLQAFIAAARGA